MPGWYRDVLVVGSKRRDICVAQHLFSLRIAFENQSGAQSDCAAQPGSATQVASSREPKFPGTITTGLGEWFVHVVPGNPITGVGSNTNPTSMTRTESLNTGPTLICILYVTVNIKKRRCQ